MNQTGGSGRQRSRGSEHEPGNDGDDLSAWRWRNYTEHLADLGYDLHGGTAANDDVSGAVDGDLRRSTR